MRHLLLLVLLSCAPAQAADIVTLSRQVLLPDGKPAVGASVLVRSFSRDKDGPWLPRDTLVATDDNGVFTAQGYRDHLYRHRLLPAPYILIDAPGCALHVLHWSAANKDDPWDATTKKDRPPLKLSSDRPIVGKVVDTSGRPLPGVALTVTSLNNGFTGWHTWSGFNAPGFKAQSRADGTFTLRAINARLPEHADGMAYLNVRVSASTTLRGYEWHAETSFAYFSLQGETPGTDMPPPRLPNPFVLKLHPTIKLRGRVVDAVTGQPKNNVLVSIKDTQAFTLNRPRPAPSPDGRFDLTATSPFRLEFTISGDKEWAQLSKEQTLVGPRTVDDLVLKVRPSAKVSGRIVEEDTGKAPPLMLYFSSKSADGTGNGWTQSGPSVTVEAGKPFTMTMPVGANTITVAVFRSAELGNEEVMRQRSAYEYRQTWNVPPSGLSNIVLKVRKRPGFFVRLTGESDDKNKDCLNFIQVRFKSGERQAMPSADNRCGPYYFLPAKNWGEAGEVRAGRLSTQMDHTAPSVLRLWTPITASPQPWPHEIVMP